MINGGGLGAQATGCWTGCAVSIIRSTPTTNAAPPVRLGNKAIALKLCRNVLIRDITIFHGGHFAILVTGCDNLTVDNVTMDTDRDGIDIDCCRNTMVSNCRINSPNDDGFARRALCVGRRASHGKSDHRELPGVRLSGRHAAGRHDEAQPGPRSAASSSARNPAAASATAPWPTARSAVAAAWRWRKWTAASWKTSPSTTSR